MDLIIRGVVCAGLGVGENAAWRVASCGLAGIAGYDLVGGEDVARVSDGSFGTDVSARGEGEDCMGWESYW